MLQRADRNDAEVRYAAAKAGIMAPHRG